jgi:hypothetical protein
MKPLLLVFFCTILLGLSGCRTNQTPEAQVTDFQISANVKTKLASEVGLATVPNISVNATNGVVTLSGIVKSGDQKSRAETIAKSVPHVVRVINNLQIAQTPTSSRVRPVFSTDEAGRFSPREWKGAYTAPATSGSTSRAIKAS